MQRVAERLKMILPMTVLLIFFLMKRVTAPLAGGLVTSFIMELLVYPAIYLLWRSRQMFRDDRCNLA